MLGISTALLQSVRMIGGMFGMALVGTLVTHYYAGAVRQSVPQGSDPSLIGLLEDPQVLVSQSVQGEFIARMQNLGMEGDVFIEAARASLVSAVHSGLSVSLLIAVIALVWVYRVPRISLSRGVATISGEPVRARKGGRP